MTVELEESAGWRHRVDARLATLERVSDEHGDKIGHQQGSFLAIHADLGEIRGQLLKQDSMIQALRLTQSEHSTALRKLRQDVTEIRQDVTELRRDVTEVRVGIRTIIDLIDQRDSGRASGQGSQDGGQGDD
jgi:chromosome segregation ATPase